MEEKIKAQIQFLIQLLNSIDAEQYKLPLACFSDKSIGQHVRHILDFYHNFFVGLEKGEICYDLRERNTKLELDKDFAKEICLQFLNKFSHLSLNEKLILKTEINNEFIEIPTTILRELAYLQEHTVHHLAILKIGIKTDLCIELPPNLGVAPSTISYEKNLN